MLSQLLSRRLALASAFLLSLSTPLCHAALGAAPNAGGTSMLRAGAMLSSANVTPYTLRQSVDSAGTTIREYTLPDNVVFAVSWEGPVRPDMSDLLGAYFHRATTPVSGPPRGIGPLVRRDSDFQIESFGRAGHFSGKAVLPRLVPAGVDAAQLQ